MSDRLDTSPAAAAAEIPAEFDPGPVPAVVEPDPGPPIRVPLGDLTALSVEGIGAGVTRLTAAHGHTAVSVLLLPHQVDELAAALVAASPVPYGLAERVDQAVTELRPQRCDYPAWVVVQGMRGEVVAEVHHSCPVHAPTAVERIELAGLVANPLPWGAPASVRRCGDVWTPTAEATSPAAGGAVYERTDPGDQHPQGTGRPWSGARFGPGGES